MRDWRRSPRFAVWFISLFFLVQLAVPVTRLGGIQSAERFGWQMFSSYQPRIDFTVHTEEGSTIVDLEDVTAGLRADLDLETLIPPFVCERIPGAVRVTWDDQSYRCPAG